MPISDSRQAQIDQIISTDLLRRSQKRFGELLREVCEASGFTQGKLSRKSKDERQRLIEAGYIRPEDPIGSMEQPTISKVMAGVQEPTYFQVFIWLRVIRTHYESTKFAEICKKLGIIPIPQFSRELEQKLWYLSTFVQPDELLRVYEETEEYVKELELSQSLIEHKETRWEKPKIGLEEKITDVDIPAFPKTDTDIKAVRIRQAVVSQKRSPIKK